MYELFCDGKSGLFFEPKSWWKDDKEKFLFWTFRWFLLGLSELSMIFQDLGKMFFCTVSEAARCKMWHHVIIYYMQPHHTTLMKQKFNGETILFQGLGESVNVTLEKHAPINNGMLELTKHPIWAKKYLALEINFQIQEVT